MAHGEPIKYDDFKIDNGVIDNFLLFFASGELAKQFRGHDALKN